MTPQALQHTQAAAEPSGHLPDPSRPGFSLRGGSTDPGRTVPVFGLGRCVPLRLSEPTPIHDPDLEWLR